MINGRIQDADMAMLSRSVKLWYNHYGAAPDEQASRTLCSAAIDLFLQGHSTQEELTSLLISRFPGPQATLTHALGLRAIQ
ncbi:hypothetical protein B5K06_28340 [Rhizobium grahamii]|uniref:Uncharacterized protein n=1 Tax=Rhizobium grahamii TaxID=1120045 RepID=A0A370KGC9_9HYPH|nr:hypothetical protein [Rhizobium grahamii]RDJ03834.1 hypothetical protein B5K06_28340 [Rhizobium grahamii]